MVFGNLNVRVLSGKIATSNHHQDYFIKVHLGNQQKQSSVYENKDKNPDFDFGTELKKTYEDKVTIEVWEKTANHQNLVGSAMLDLVELSHRGNKTNEWLELLNKNKIVGEISVEVILIPDKEEQLLKSPPKSGHSFHKVHTKSSNADK